MPKRAALRGNRLLAVAIIASLAILSVAYLLVNGFGTPKTNTGISPTVVLVDSNGNPAKLDASGQWVPMSVVDSSGRDVTSGQVEISLDGSFDYQGTISTWSVSGDMKAVTEGSKVIKTWPISASGVGAPPAKWPLKISGASKAIAKIAEAKSYWGGYGVKAIAFKVTATLTVNFADGTTATRELVDQTVANVGGLTYKADSSVSNFQVSANPVTSTGTGPSQPSQPSPPPQPSGGTSTLIIVAKKNNQPVQGAYVFFHNLPQYSFGSGGKYTDSSGQAVFSVPADTYLQVQVNFPPNGPAVGTGTTSALTGQSKTFTVTAEGYAMNLIRW